MRWLRKKPDNRSDGGLMFLTVTKTKTRNNPSQGKEAAGEKAKKRERDGGNRRGREGEERRPEICLVTGTPTQHAGKVQYTDRLVRWSLVAVVASKYCLCGRYPGRCCPREEKKRWRCLRPTTAQGRTVWMGTDGKGNGVVCYGVGADGHRVSGVSQPVTGQVLKRQGPTREAFSRDPGLSAP